MTTDIIRKASIEELVAHRTRAIEAFAQAEAAIEAANAAAKRAAPSFQYAGGAQALASPSRSRFSCKSQAEEWRRGVDRDCWNNLLMASGLGALMGAKQKGEFQKLLEDNPPEFTVETAFATFADKMGNAGAIFNESVVNAFKSAPKGFKSNDSFHVGSRMILDYAVSHYMNHATWYSSSYGSQAIDIVRDLDRIMHQLDGKPFETDATQIASVAMREGKSECETEYFRFRWFRKSTMHVWFKRDDLVREMNRIIADHYGAVLGQAA
ncbi:DUF4942 domain-containing protein [Gellertiella hungarica]|uniref:DUF4942 domain-containing protein n=1 Tax=Gellertiella hungarica TaxID=1572859 RepID=A0A7W6JAB9_9HYPH|nr:DUF4942 domain-containing protein [Gellertiella hungarica]MBB4066768.1 hypothetical protein [Gellertiella hungarica]